MQKQKHNPEQLMALYDLLYLESDIIRFWLSAERGTCKLAFKEASKKKEDLNNDYINQQKKINKLLGTDTPIKSAYKYYREYKLKWLKR